VVATPDGKPAYVYVTSASLSPSCTDEKFSKLNHIVVKLLKNYQKQLF